MQLGDLALISTFLSIAGWNSHCSATDQPSTGEVKVSGTVFTTVKGSSRDKKPVPGAAVHLAKIPTGWKLTPSDDPVELKFAKGLLVPEFACVQVGQKLVVKCPEGEVFSLHADSPERGDFGRTIPRDPTVFSDSFPKPDDRVLLKCSIHPTAKARIQVVPTPGFAQCDSNGKFTLPRRLPKGEHVLKGYFPGKGWAEKTINLRGDEGEVSVELELTPRKEKEQK